MARVLDSDLRLGRDLAGYHLEAQIGRGEMGAVYLAQDPRLEREVALKVLAPELTRSEGFRERFLKDSKLASSLEHLNVVPIYEAGEAEGLLYLVMRYIEGTDLKGLIKKEGRLQPARAISILAQAAVALDGTHAEGLVHSAVKPSNVLLAEDAEAEARDRAYLSDFGLTRRAAERADLTERGQLIGTLDYMAPEQIEDGPLVAQTDIYALGCVLYECLTGDVPYRQESKIALLWAHLDDESPRPSERGIGLPVALDSVVAKALAKASSQRYQSCAQLILAAETAIGQIEL